MINEELLDILEKLQEGDKSIVKAHNEVLDLFIVMLSEIELEADKVSNTIDNGLSDYSLGQSQGFDSGVAFVIGEIKRRNHSA